MKADSRSGNKAAGDLKCIVLSNSSLFGCGRRGVESRMMGLGLRGVLEFIC